MQDQFSVFTEWFAEQHHYSGLRPVPENRPAERQLPDPSLPESEIPSAPTQFESEFEELAALAGLPEKPSMTTAEVEALGAKICAFASRMASATCVWLMMIAEFDRQEGWTGTKSCAHWLSWACSVSPGTAREQVRVARSMMEMPLMLEEFGRGRLSYSKVRELTRVKTLLPEQELVEMARIMTASQLAKSVRAFRRHHPDRLRQELRRRTRWYTDADGSVVLQARLPAEEGALLVAALEGAHDLLLRTEQERIRIEVGAEPGPARVSHSDAILHLANLQLDALPPEVSGADRHLVVVHVDSQLLVAGRDQLNVGNDEEPSTMDSPEPAGIDLTAVPAHACQIQGTGGISADTAARLACDAVVTTMVRSAGGAVLQHGRKHRLVQAAQRRALMVRDGQCRHPGCDRTTYLEAHHVNHWAGGGRTDLDNLVLLCRFHHMACHEGGVQISPGIGSSPGLPLWEFRTAGGELLNGSRDQTRSDVAGDEELLWQGISQIQEWSNEEADRIRPLWMGERFSLQDVLSHLYRRLPEKAAA